MVDYQLELMFVQVLCSTLIAAAGLNLKLILHLNIFQGAISSVCSGITIP